MANSKWLRFSALLLATAIALYCLVAVWAEYTVATSAVPARADLFEVTGPLQTCEPEAPGPIAKLRGAWGDVPTYLLTVKGIEGRFRTTVFDCGSRQSGQSEASGAVESVRFWTTREPVHVDGDGKRFYNAYGLGRDGSEAESYATDLLEQHAFHDWRAFMNGVFILLLALVLPGLLIACIRGQLWRDPPAPTRDGESAAAHGAVPVDPT